MWYPILALFTLRRGNLETATPARAALLQERCRSQLLLRDAPRPRTNRRRHAPSGPLRTDSAFPFHAPSVDVETTHAHYETEPARGSGRVTQLKCATCTKDYSEFYAGDAALLTIAACPPTIGEARAAEPVGSHPMRRAREGRVVKVYGAEAWAPRACRRSHMGRA